MLVLAAALVEVVGVGVVALQVCVISHNRTLAVAAGRWPHSVAMVAVTMDAMVAVTMEATVAVTMAATPVEKEYDTLSVHLTYI